MAIDDLLKKQAADAAKRGAKGAAAKAAGNATVLIALRFAGTVVVKQIVQKVVAWQMTRIAAWFAARRAASGLLAAVPIIGVAMLAWTASDIFDAAMRKTIPTVIEVALLRTEFP